MAGPMMNNGRGSRASFRHKPMGEINVTPFVDVMLVLLVVFMVTAPLITQGVQINLPEVENTQMSEEKEPVSISVKASGDVFIQSQLVKMDDLPAKLKAIARVRENSSVLLNADKNVDYGRVMEVMSQLQLAGLTDIGLVTAPPSN